MAAMGCLGSARNHLTPMTIQRPAIRMKSKLLSATLCLFVVAGTGWCPAAEAKARLLDHFGGLRGGFGKKNQEKAKVLSGPTEVKMLRGESPGKVWQVTLGDTPFKITIEDKVNLQVADCLKRVENLPPAYRKVFQIVSEGTKNGVAIYANLDGAAAHGSQDYLNIVPDADAMVIAHESGHILEQRVSSAQPKTLEHWQQAITADKISVSAYGDQVAHEDLAEFALAYAMCLDAGKEKLTELKRLSPQRFAQWELILKTAAPAAKAASKPAAAKP